MPASNSEARKRHEAEAATTDAMAEALSNVASGVVLEPLPIPKPGTPCLHCGGTRRVPTWFADNDATEPCPACTDKADR